MKKLILSVPLVLALSSCSKELTSMENTIDSSVTVVDAITTMKGNPDATLVFQFQETSKKEFISFSNVVSLKNKDISGKTFYNDVEIPVNRDFYINQVTTNPKSTPGYEDVSKNSVGKTGVFKMKGFKTVSDNEIEIKIPSLIDFEAQRTENGINLKWKGGNTNIDMIDFSVMMPSGILNESLNIQKSVIKTFRFKLSNHEGFISNSELDGFVENSSIVIEATTGSFKKTEVDGKTIAAIAILKSTKNILFQKNQ